MGRGYIVHVYTKNGKFYWNALKSFKNFIQNFFCDWKSERKSNICKQMNFFSWKTRKLMAKRSLVLLIKQLEISVWRCEGQCMCTVQGRLWLPVLGKFGSCSHIVTLSCMKLIILHIEPWNFVFTLIMLLFIFRKLNLITSSMGATSALFPLHFGNI